MERVQAMPVKVGDKVRLLRWRGRCDGLMWDPRNRGLVGRILEVYELQDKNGGIAWVGSAWWPVSKLDPVHDTESPAS